MYACNFWEKKWDKNNGAQKIGVGHPIRLRSLGQSNLLADMVFIIIIIIIIIFGTPAQSL